MEREGRQHSSWDEAQACHLGPDAAPLLAAVARMPPDDLAAFTAGARRMALRLESAGEPDVAAVWHALGALGTDEEHRRRDVAEARLAEAEAARHQAPVVSETLSVDTTPQRPRRRSRR